MSRDRETKKTTPELTATEALEFLSQLVGIVLLVIGLVSVVGWAWTGVITGTLLVVGPEIRRYAGDRHESEETAG